MNTIHISNHLGMRNQGWTRQTEAGSLTSRAIAMFKIPDAGMNLESKTNWKLNELEEYLSRLARAARAEAVKSDYIVAEGFAR